MVVANIVGTGDVVVLHAKGVGAGAEGRKFRWLTAAVVLSLSLIGPRAHAADVLLVGTGGAGGGDGGAGSIRGGNGGSDFFLPGSGGASSVPAPTQTIASPADGSSLLSTYDYIGIGGGAGGGDGGNLGGVHGGTGGAGVLNLNGTTLDVTNTLLIGGAGGGGGSGGAGNIPGGNGGTGGSGTLTATGGAAITVGTQLYIGGLGGTGGNCGCSGGGGVGGAGVFNLGDASTLSLTGANLTINGNGILNIGNATANGTTAGTITGLAGSIANAGTINFNQSDATYTFSTAIAGTGQVVQNGSGTTFLIGANSYSGGTTVNAGLINFANGGNLGTGNITLNGGGLQWATGNTTDISSRLNALGASGGTFDTNGNNVTLASGLSGAGGLTKAGTGTLTLTGVNAYTGGTTITSGTLLMSGAGTLGNNAGALTVSGGTLDLGGTAQTQDGGVTLGGGTVQNGTLSSSGAFAGQAGTVNATLAGTGGLTKSGTGTLILDGVNTYTGGTTVSGGMLEIGDASHTGAGILGPVTVGAAGTLAGHGTIGGGVTNTAGGIVAPGGSIGTLSVASYTQGASSTLQIEVSPNAASKLAVIGAASLNGTLSLVYDPGVYSATTYDIVHAGSISGTFGTVTSSGSVPTNVGQSVAYSGTDVDLVLTQSASTFVVRPTNDTVFSSLSTSALLGGQQANATLLGHLADAHSGTGSDTIETALAGATPTQFAFDGGAAHLSDAVAQLPDTMAQLGGWFRATGTFAGLSSSSVPGVDTQGGGFMAGLDRPIDANLTVGIAGGYSHTNLSQHDQESGTLDTPRIAAYGSYVMGPWAFDATAGYAYDHVSEKRPLAGIGTASGTYDAHEATGAAQASYRFDYAGFSVMPNAGLTYVHLFDNGVDEGGATGFNLDVSHRNADSLRPFIGISASTPITTSGGLRLVPEGDIRYSHELFATAPSIVSVGGGNFSVNGITPSHDLLTVGGGVTASLSDRLALFADYHATLPTGNYWQQTISAGARYKF